MKNVLFLIICCFFIHQGKAQSFVFGPKLGPAIGFQSFDGFEKEPLLAYHGAFYIESYDDDAASTLYAQVGWHVRGSTNRLRFFTFNNAFTQNAKFKFNNIALTLGAKRRLNMESKYRPYYLIGIRGEYTVSTNLDDYTQRNQYYNSLVYPDNGFVNKINYGFVAGGGFEVMFSELVGGLIEIVFSPDVSNQYHQPPITNVADPRNIGSTTNIGERKIKNYTFEISLGLRLLRKVEYYD
jgi:hypothetical protein